MGKGFGPGAFGRGAPGSSALEADFITVNPLDHA